MIIPHKTLFAALALLGGILTAAPAQSIDNRAISSGRNDVVYLAPALHSYEALPIGNGTLGATVWNENGMNYQLNNGEFFETPDESSGLFSSGHATLELPPEWMKGFVEERLSLSDAKVITKFQTGNVHHQIRSWMAEGLDTLVIQIDSDEPIPDLTLSLSIWQRQPNSLDIAPWFRGPPVTVAASANDVSVTTLGLSNHNAVSMVAAPLEGQVKTIQNDERTVTMTILSGNRKHLTILVANPLTEGTAVDAATALATARDVIAKARTKGDDALQKDHDAYWRDFWSKSSLVLHSPDGFGDYLENLYDLFNYWMGSSSRGQDPPKFNGGNFLLYEDDRSWAGCYWYNNTREMYWALLPANHTELFAPFINLYWNALPNSRIIAHELYDSTGACFEEVLSRRGDSHDKYANPGTGLYLTTGTEMAFQMYQYYLYTGDETFLRETAYPLLKETVTFQLNFLNKESDGLYHVYPSNTRETYHWVKDSLTDLSAMRAVLPILIKTSEKLGVDPTERAHWLDVLDHLAPFVRDPKTNQILPATFLDQWPPTRFAKMEKLYPPATERTSTKGQLFNSENISSEMIVPWNIYGLDSSPEDLARARDTFMHRPYNHLGYGIAWDPSPLCAARLGLPDEMIRSLGQYVQSIQMFPSGMATTPGNLSPHWAKVLADSPALDSAGAMSDAVAESVLQSYNGRIRVFPAMPAKWEGEFTLAAVGGFLVSSKMNSDGVIPFVKIVSRRGGTCLVTNPWQEAAVLKSPGGEKEFAAGGLISFPTETGGIYELRPKSAPPDGNSIALTRCYGPKWPFHIGPDDTAEAYMARIPGSSGMLGIARDGSNPARNLVKRGHY
jgi:alpha-L-fucosidase 2